MSLDLNLVAKVMMTANGFADAQARGVSANMLFEEGKAAWLFIEHFVKTYGTMPSRDAVEQQVKIALPTPESVSDPVEYYLDEVIERSNSNILATAFTDAWKTGKCHDAVATARAYIEAGNRVLGMSNRGSTVVDYASEDAHKARIEQYARVKRGEMTGLATGWPSLDKATGGIHTHELWTILARTKAGKSWLATYLSHSIWNSGMRDVLLVSMEMGSASFGRRLDATRFRLPYADLAAGRLSTPAEEKWLNGGPPLNGGARLRIADRASVRTVGDVETLAREYRPQVILVDGAYFLQTGERSKSKWERTAAVVDQLQALVHRLQTPIVMTWQYNRGGGRRGSSAEGNPRSEDVGFAYEVVMASDVVLSLVRDPQDEGFRKARIDNLESREAQRCPAFEINFDLEKLDFSELVREQVRQSEIGHPEQ